MNKTLSILIDWNLGNDIGPECAVILQHSASEIDATVLVLRSVPYQIGPLFVPIVAVCDRCTFRNGFGVLAVLPRANPFIGVRVPGLQEESSEMFCTRTSNAYLNLLSRLIIVGRSPDLKR